MIKKIDVMNLFSLGLIILIPICLVLRIIALFTAFDSHIGYFDTSAVITYFDRAFLTISIIFGIAVSFLIKKETIESSAHSNLWSILASLLFGFVWMVSALLLFLIGTLKTSPLGYVALVASVGSAAYYIYEGFRPIKKLSTGRVLSALVPLIALLSMIFIENFDFYVTLNNQDKQLAMFVFVLASLFIVQKLKCFTDTPSTKLYACSAFLTLLLSLYFAIPGILGNLFHVTDEPKYLVYYLISLGIAIYTATDLIGRIRLSSFEKEIATDTTEK